MVGQPFNMMHSDVETWGKSKVALIAFVICCVSVYGSKDWTWKVDDRPAPPIGDRA